MHDLRKRLLSGPFGSATRTRHKLQIGPRGRHSLFYVRFWTEESALHGLPDFQVVERSCPALLLRTF